MNALRTSDFSLVSRLPGVLPEGWGTVAHDAVATGSLGSTTRLRARKTEHHGVRRLGALGRNVGCSCALTMGRNVLGCGWGAAGRQCAGATRALSRGGRRG